MYGVKERCVVLLFLLVISRDSCSVISRVLICQNGNSESLAGEIVVGIDLFCVKEHVKSNKHF